MLFLLVDIMSLSDLDLVGDYKVFLLVLLSKSFILFLFKKLNL